MTNPNSFHHVSVGKPQQTKQRSSYLHDLGNGNFLDSVMANPASEPVIASVLPFREYHGALEKAPKPREAGPKQYVARPRNYTAPVPPNIRYGPSSWPEVPTLHNNTRTQDDYSPVPHASSDDDAISFQDAVEPISYPTVLPLYDHDTDWSPNSMLCCPAQFSENSIVCADEAPVKSIPQVYPKFSTHVELHPYLSSPPFGHSFLYHPELLYRIGFLGLNDYATTPPKSEMNITAPFLPWWICLYQTQYITVYDVFVAIFDLLHESPTGSEVRILYSSSDTKRYRKIMSTCKKRSTEVNAGDYLRKIDWLGDNHIFVCLSKVYDDDQRGRLWRLSLRRVDE